MILKSEQSPLKLNKLKALFIAMALTVSSFCQAQYDTASVKAVIAKLAAMQVQEDPFYDQGLFRSYRKWDDQMVEDNTFSYPATISYWLTTFQEQLPNEVQPQAEQIIANVNKNWFRYANRKGEASFNFWQTIAPDLPFPNGTKYRKHGNRLPDDLDDSSMIAMALSDDSLSATVRQKIVNYAKSNNHKEVDSAPRPLRRSEAYRTWFADKWIQDLDVGVMSNILMFNFINGFPLNHYDSATIQHIDQVIKSDLHFEEPDKVSPYYTSTAKIIYHIARMISFDQAGYFDDLKSTLLADCQKAWDTSGSEMERLMLLTANGWLGGGKLGVLDEEELLADIQSFYFFSGFGYLPFPPAKSWMIKTFKLVPDMYWISPAFNLGLTLEYLMVTGNKIDPTLMDRIPNKLL